MELNTYSFSPEDIYLITFALRRLNKETEFQNLKTETTDLLNFIEIEKGRIQKEKDRESVRNRFREMAKRR